MNNRYHVDRLQGETQPGSDGQVLVNKLSITNAEDMALAELILLEQLYEAVLIDDLPDRTLIVADLCEWHRRWLGNVYGWAGQLRTVNVSKGGFMFANVTLVQSLLAAFQRDYLERHTPCRRLTDAELAEAIAICHVEIILIHPFREGNGRLSRLLADVMAVQAGHAPLDYSAWDADKERYFAGIGAGQANNYAPMQQLVGLALRRAG